MEPNDSRDTLAADSAKVHDLVRRVLRSGGLDLDAVEELVFFQQFNDALALTVTTDPVTERNLIQEAFHQELYEYIQLLADNRLTKDERVRLRSSMYAASGRLFDPAAALAPYEHLLAATPG